MTANETLELLKGSWYVMEMNLYYLIVLDDEQEQSRESCQRGQFLEAIRAAADGKGHPRVIGAEILACYMGPFVCHNTFTVHFGMDGKVQFVTPVEMWD